MQDNICLNKMVCNKCKHKKCKKCKKKKYYGGALEDVEEEEAPKPTAGEVIRDVVSMTPVGAAVRFVSDMFIPPSPVAALATPADFARWKEQRRIAHIQHGGHSGSGIF